MRTGGLQTFLYPQHFGRWLIALVALLNLVVAGFAVSSVSNSREHYQQQAQVQTQNLAQAIDQNLANSADKINQALRVVVSELEHMLSTDGIDRRLLLRVIGQQKALMPEAVGFRVIDAEGRLLFEDDPDVVSTENIADREYFFVSKASHGAGMVVSKPVLSRFTGNWVMPFALRYDHPDGRFAGIVVVPVALSHFSHLMSRYEVGKGGILVLRDRDMGLVVRHSRYPPGDGIQVGDSRVTAELRQAAASGATYGTYQAKSASDGVERILSFRHIRNADMFVVAGLSREYYLERWRRDILEAVLFFIGFLAVTSGLALMLHRAWRKQMRDTLALQENHERLNMLLAELQERDYALAVAQQEGGLGTFLMDIRQDKWSCSDELDGLLGIDSDYPHTLEGWKALLHPDDRAAVARHLQEDVLERKQPFSREYRIVRPRDGAPRWVYSFGRVELSEQGEPAWFRGVIRDVTEKKQMEERLLLAREAFLHGHEAIIIADRDANIIDVNPAFTAITGYSREEVLGENPRILQSGRQDAAFYRAMWDDLLREGFWEGELHNKRKDGRLYSQSTRISTVRDEQQGTLRYIGVASDITAIRASQLQIEYMALHDKLTDLPNRVQLAERLGQAIARADEDGSLLAVCYLDLDGFKAINDIWGHDVGDMVLVEAARRLQGCIGPIDTVARLGGDEFVVLLCSSSSVGEITDRLTRILMALSRPFEANQIRSEVTASIGVAIYPDDIEDADLLIRRADQAMYIAKRLGRNQFHLFDSETDRRLKKTHELGLRIATALEQNEFRLYYQPKVEMLTGKVVGAEALIRWHHPGSGVLPPLEFLPVVENTELSIRLGEWIIRQALAQMAAWKRQGLNLPVSVNISGCHLQRPDFVRRLAAMLAEYPSISPSWLELEILETMAMEDVEQVSKIINDCAQLGVSFSLDDFGTGYSSLTYFRRLPTQLLKIDHSFVRDILTDAEDYALVESIVKLAHSFNRQVIAEGVETIEHGLPLMKFGCNLAQGYGIARPMPSGDIPEWIRNWSIPDPWRQFAEQMRVSRELSGFTPDLHESY